jgi:hypothetical protein
MKPNVKLDISDWNIPIDLQLADESFNQPVVIDVLLAANIFYKILRPGRKTRPGNYPVLQETALGWQFLARHQLPHPTILHIKHYSSEIIPTLHEKLQRFWELESFDKPALSPDTWPKMAFTNVTFQK